VSKKVEQINDYLYIDKSNKIKMIEMRVNDSEMSTRRNSKVWSIPDKSVMR